MRRRLLNLLTAVSLLLCVAVLALWVRSYNVGDRLTWTHLERRAGFLDSRFVTLYSGAGAFMVERRAGTETGALLSAHHFGESGFRWEQRSHPYYPRNIDSFWGTSYEGMGFWWMRNRGESDEPDYLEKPRTRAWSDHLVVVPWWSLATLSLILPAVRALASVRRMRRRRHEKSGLCSACGYDLRATPGRCPECGHQPSPAGMLLKG